VIEVDLTRGHTTAKFTISTNFAQLVKLEEALEQLIDAYDLPEIVRKAVPEPVSDWANDERDRLVTMRDQLTEARNAHHAERSPIRVVPNASSNP
jgi:hypothetical protein